MKAALLVSCATALAASIGCASSSQIDAYQSRLIVGASAEQLLPEAQAVMMHEFPRVQVNPATRKLEADPVAFTTHSESGTLSDVYRGSASMRRKATIFLTPASTGTLVKARVEVERQDTDRERAMREQQAPDYNRLGNDTPTYTAIQRDAATTPRQNAVWTFVRRDYQLERAMLDELERRVAPAAEPSDSPAPAPPGPGS